MERSTPRKPLASLPSPPLLLSRVHWGPIGKGTGAPQDAVKLSEPPNLNLSMSIPKSPFSPSTSAPGIGKITVGLLPPRKQILKDLTYQYPLKLIAPDPHTAAEAQDHITLVFLLTYGGGLVGGDQISLDVDLEIGTRLVLVTQGSTKLFKTPSRSIVSAQTLNVNIARGASLCYLPDPTQPFAESVYEQKQTFFVASDGTSSLCVLDWVSEGRRARGESWSLWSWKGRNEIREASEEESGSCRLLLRDAMALTDKTARGTEGVGGLADKTDGLGVFGTLILYGSTFSKLKQFFLEEFKTQPRLGAKNWSHQTNRTAPSEVEQRRQRRTHQEIASGLLWTCAETRGFVVLKFGAREIDGARRWLGDFIRSEGTIEKGFGHQSLIGLR